MRTLRLSLLTIGVAILLAPIVSRAQAPGYRGIPAGFDYPADKAKLEQYRQAGNLPALRRHGWMLFAGMTQEKADGTPYWETWYRVPQTFRPAGPSLQGPTVAFPFETPNQFKHPGPGLQAPGQSVMSFVLFNWEGHNHIRTERLFEQSKLTQLNASFPASKPWSERKVPDFPARAMTLKTIWWPAAGDAKTPLPIWDNNPSQPIDKFNVNEFINWKRVVAVDGTRQSVPDGEFVDIRFNSKTFTHSHVVGLDHFYAVKVDAALAQAIGQNPDSGVRVMIRQALGRSLRPGDYMLFLGMHVTSKEIDNWTWQTFWWHDQANIDTQNQPPGIAKYAADRPDAVKGVWRNYLMATADDQVLPREPDGTPHIGYNPWLEARFPNGVLTNCMTCHHRASWPPTVGFIDPDHLEWLRGLPDPADDPAFASGRLQTDFMWSIIDRAK